MRVAYKLNERHGSAVGRVPGSSTRLDRYEARLAKTSSEIASALRLRHEVFNVELGGAAVKTGGIEFDEYDFRCEHLIVTCRQTGRTVGTYRLNMMETTGTADGFYSAGEFTIEDLPPEILRDGIEIGRACIAKEHRNTKVLFLLWKALLNRLETADKRYFFGCCSIFTRDERTGAIAQHQLERGGHFSDKHRVEPRRNRIRGHQEHPGERIELPSLFEMYLRLGAKVCGPPMIDREFGSIDFFVVFDVRDLDEKHRRLFSR